MEQLPREEQVLLAIITREKRVNPNNLQSIELLKKLSSGALFSGNKLHETISNLRDLGLVEFEEKNGKPENIKLTLTGRICAANRGKMNASPILQKPEQKTGGNPFVFLCHRFLDKSIARVVADYLDEAGIKYFLDERNIEYVWPEEIEKALLDATHMYVINTRNFEGGKTCLLELGYATALLKKRGIPKIKTLKFDEAEPPNILGIKSLHYENVAERGLHKTMEKLIKELGSTGKLTERKIPQIKYNDSISPKKLNELISEVSFLNRQAKTVYKCWEENEFTIPINDEDFRVVVDETETKKWLESNSLLEECKFIKKGIVALNANLEDTTHNRGILSTLIQRIGQLETSLKTQLEIVSKT
ncbi:MAG: toll/interleukin-1 receptor domain-containing protein [Candidatus Diapherotrites archaeon]|nr:toll/interleukin-1 receptor domain-containing protein [Candidatus Diapherotrites archaeon]